MKESELGRMGRRKEERGDETWGATLIELVMNKTLTQRVNENTSLGMTIYYSTIYYLLFTKEQDWIENIKFKCPLGKSDHVLIQVNSMKKI